MLRSALLLAALCGAPAFAQSVTLDRVDPQVVAGDPLSVTFTAQAGPDQPIDKIVAVVTDPKGRTLTDRNLSTADLAPGTSLTKSSSDRVPPRSLAGAYQVRAEARAFDGSVLATSQTESFVVIAPDETPRSPFPGFSLRVSNVPATVSAGTPITLDLSIVNSTDQTADKVFAIVTDPSGRVLTRTLLAADVKPGKTLERTVSESIPPGTKRGTYRVQIQALSPTGEVLGMRPASFEVTD
jgi:hypothetical protein